MLIKEDEQMGKKQEPEVPYYPIFLDGKPAWAKLGHSKINGQAAPRPVQQWVNGQGEIFNLSLIAYSESTMKAFNTHDATPTMFQVTDGQGRLCIRVWQIYSFPGKLQAQIYDPNAQITKDPSHARLKSVARSDLMDCNGDNVIKQMLQEWGAQTKQRFWRIKELFPQVAYSFTSDTLKEYHKAFIAHSWSSGASKTYHPFNDFSST